MINNFIKELNENKIFIGTMMIIVTIGGRFIINELDDSQKELINNQWVKKLFIFCAFFMATRDIYCSITLTILFTIVLDLFNSGDKQPLNKEGYTNKKIDNLINELNELKKDL